MSVAARNTLIEDIAGTLEPLKARVLRGVHSAGEKGLTRREIAEIVVQRPLTTAASVEEAEIRAKQEISKVRTACRKYFDHQTSVAFDIRPANKAGGVYRLQWYDLPSSAERALEAPRDTSEQPSESIIPLSDSGRRRNLASFVGPLGGEGRMCAAVSLGYGVMMGVSLPMEVAYRWSDFENWVIPASVAIGASSAAVAVMTFQLIRRRASAGQFDSLGRAASILFLWSLATCVIAAWLPNEAIVKARFTTMPAKVGWPKSVLEALGLPILSLVPVQAVFALRYLISSGHWEVARSIVGRRTGLSGVQGAFVPGAWASFTAFTVVTLWRISVDGHLIEGLETGPYSGLFVQFLMIRSGVGCMMLFTLLLWYLLRLNGFENEVARSEGLGND